MAEEPDVISIDELVEQEVILEPALAVGPVFTITFVVFDIFIVLLQYEDDKLVIVTVVVPKFIVGVVNVPDPGLPAVKFMVAVKPVADVEPLKL